MNLADMSLGGSVKKGAIKAYIFWKLGVYYLRIHGFRTTLFAIRDLRWAISGSPISWLPISCWRLGWLQRSRLALSWLKLYRLTAKDIARWLTLPSRMKMITLLSAPLPIALSLATPSLPEVATLALVLLITLAMALVLSALVVAMAGTVNTVSSSARKQQDLTLTSNANPMTETPANRLAMLHFLHKKFHRHAALLLKQIGPCSSLRHPMIHARSRWPSHKGSLFTLAAPELPLNIQKLTIAGTDNPVASYLAETPANRFAMTFTHRHAASTSMYAQPTRPWVGRSSRKGSWFTLAATVLPLNIQKLTMSVNNNFITI